MTTPTPSPDVPEAAPAPAPMPDAPVLPAGPSCAACGDEAVVHWRRRPTAGELAELVAAEQARRDQVLLLADPQLPEPEFPPLPTADGMTRTVYACGSHAIGIEAASLIHAAGCTAPNPKHLPGCDCTPEALPDAPLEDSADDQALSRLPASWTNGGT